VLQAAAARAAPATGTGPRLLLALARTWRYPAGLALDGVGFLLSLVALRTLPLYVVQSVAASFLAVTAVLGMLFLGTRMRRGDVLSLAAVVLGLVLVGLSAAAQRADNVGTRVQVLILVAAVALALAPVVVRRLGDGASAWVLGGAAGLGFGVVAVAARALPPSATGRHPGHDLHLLLGAPALYALLVATPFALTAYATALQRGTVVQATAPLVVGETVLPALAGLALFGDHPRPGWGVVAVLGFALAVGATLQLSRYGEVEAGAEAGDGTGAPARS
jgi:drug/metabolite transporter (DMT)-like permease